MVYGLRLVEPENPSTRDDAKEFMAVISFASGIRMENDDLVKCEVCGTEVKASNLKKHMRRRHRKEIPATRMSKRTGANHPNFLMSGQLAEAQMVWEFTNLELRENAAGLEDDLEDLKIYAPAVAYAFLEVEDFRKARKFYSLHLTVAGDMPMEEDLFASLDDLEDVCENGAGKRDMKEIRELLHFTKRLKMRKTTVRLLEAAVAGEPEIHTWKLALIEALLAANRFEEAVTLAEELRDGARARCFMGVARIMQGRLDEGMELLKDNLKRNKGYTEGWYTLGLARMEKDDEKSAMEAFNLALKANREHAPSWYRKFKIYREKGDHSMAKACYDRAIRINALWVKEEIIRESRKAGRGKAGE